MSNFNSHGNGHLPSNKSQHELVPVPKDILPASYRFQLTEKFRAAVTKYAGIALPSAYNLAYWRKTVGDPAWEKELAEADADNKQALDEHSRKVAEIDADNQRRAESNRQRQEEYDRQMVVYKRQLRQLPAREEQARQKAAAEVKRQCIENLERAIDNQTPAIEQALKHARDIVDEEKRNSSVAFYIKVVQAIGVLTVLTVIGTSIAACVTCLMRRALNKRYRRRLAEVLTNYNSSYFCNTTSQPRAVFWLRDMGNSGSSEISVYSPVHLVETLAPMKAIGRNHREMHPLGCYPPDAFDRPMSNAQFLLLLLDLCLSALPGFGLLWMFFSTDFLPYDLIKCMQQNVDASSITRHRKEALTKLLIEELDCPEVLDRLVQQRLKETKPSWPDVPVEPQPAIIEPLQSPPALGMLRTPIKLEPPSWCFDDTERGDFSHILKGSLVHDAKHVGLLSRYRVFADDSVRPYFMVGGVPIPHSKSAPHFLVMGTTGSGKTTTILRLMSSLLPLTRRQAARVISRSQNVEERFPESGDEWSRSRTHQAVIYNAKGEYLNVLKAFGFDQDIDLFSFDPVDPNGYAWDVATDIDDADSIKQFAEQLIPQSSSAKRDEGVEMWLSNARGAVEAVIVSLRNAARAAGKKPDWNLRDLVQAFATDETFRNILRWHDTPQERISRYFDLAGPQQSSIFVTLREAIDKFAIIANRWHDLQQRGRIISLKHWARNCSHSVLLLPNTKANVQAYGPLNAALLKELTNIVLQPEYSFYRDKDGKPQCCRRQFIFDEFGHAGRLHDIDRLMGEGRSFGVNCILGVHQLSQPQEVYGEHLTETILGLCSYRIFLKAGDVKTAEWMSKYVGNCLRAYDKTSYTYGSSQSKSFTNTEQHTSGTSRGASHATTNGTSNGTSDTYGTSASHSTSQQISVSSTPGQRASTTRAKSESNGTSSSESHTHSHSTQESTTEGTSRQQHESTSSSHSQGTSDTASNSQSRSKELRGEAAIELHEFLNFPDPSVSGVCEGVYISPSLPVWRVQLTKDEMEPRYEFPERLDDWPVRRSREEDERVSKSVSWTADDLARLCLDLPAGELPPPAAGWAGRQALLSPPENFEPPDVESESSSDSGAPSDEESEDEEPPQADFDF